MSKQFQSLNDTFNVKPEVVEDNEAIIVPDVSPHMKKEEERLIQIENDYTYTRKNLYSIIEKGQDALESALIAAQETDEARKYEVVSQLIKSVSDATDKLMELQKNIAKLQENKKQKMVPTTVNNSVFVGSTSELAKFVKSQIKSADNK